MLGFVLLCMLCCLWQIFHEAPPYSDMSPHEAAVLVVNGGSLVPHASTPAPVAELMNQCFSHDPAARPTLAQVHAALAGVMASPDLLHRAYTKPVEPAAVVVTMPDASDPQGSSVASLLHGPWTCTGCAFADNLPEAQLCFMCARKRSVEDATMASATATANTTTTEQSNGPPWQCPACYMDNAGGTTHCVMCTCARPIPTP